MGLTVAGACVGARVADAVSVAADDAGLLLLLLLPPVVLLLVPLLPLLLLSMCLQDGVVATRTEYADNMVKLGMGNEAHFAKVTLPACAH
jgi:hypothetical protein